MELRQYRHVLALADHAGFRKASQALGLTQPALTKSLFQIEREVGQRLFDRHGHTISPTVFGAIVVDTAREMLDSQEAMTRAIGQTAALDAANGRPPGASSTGTRAPSLGGVPSRPACIKGRLASSLTGSPGEG